MSNYQLYEDALTSAGCGTPLWEPSSTPGQTRIGDVGYLRFGTFVRLFNVTLPYGHPENEYGEPEHYVPLEVHPTQRVRTVLPKGVIASSGVQVLTSQQDNSDTSIRFKCTEKAGAVVLTDDEAIREDVADLVPFADYAATHSRNWIKFARRTLLRDVALHELILLTGCDLTNGLYSVTVFNGACPSKRSGRGSSFQLSNPSSGTHIYSSPQSISYFQHNYGPSPSLPSVAPCLFIRGFKVLDRDIERMLYLEGDQNDLEDIRGTAQYRGPLDAILRYLCDKSTAEMAMVHDVDLLRLIRVHKDKASWDYNSVLKRLRKSHTPFVGEGLVASLI